MHLAPRPALHPALNHAIGVMLGKQQRLLDEVNSAASVEAVNAIVWQ